MNHRTLQKILAAAAQTKHISYYHHGMTTGLGLMHRRDRMIQTGRRKVNAVALEMCHNSVDNRGKHGTILLSW